MYLGNRVTNTTAEYVGLIVGLAWIKENFTDTWDKMINIKMDSVLVVKQLKSEWSVRNPRV